MTRTALVFRHMSDDTGGCFPFLLRKRGFEVSFVEWHQGQTPDNLPATDLIVVLGGAQQVWQEDEHPWLMDEKAVIRDWVASRAKPFIGLCLGHQLLADSLQESLGCHHAVRFAQLATFVFNADIAVIAGVQHDLHHAQVIRLDFVPVVIKVV